MKVRTGIFVEDSSMGVREVTVITDAYNVDPISDNAVIGFKMKSFAKFSDVSEAYSAYHGYAQRSNVPCMQVILFTYGRFF